MKYLDIINTKAFKEMLDLPIGKDRIVKYSKNSVHVLRNFQDDKPILQAYFFQTPKVQYLLDLFAPSMIFNQYHLRFLNSIFTVTGLANNIHSGSSGVWATVRGGNNLAVGTGDHYCYFDGVNYALDRIFTTWDTSSLTSSATISSAFERIVGTGATANPDSCVLNLVAHTTASNTSLVTGDWGNIDVTSFGSVSFAAFNTAGNNDITLNATGISAISLTSYTKIAMRFDRDINNTAPTADNHLTFDNTIGYLSVTYTLPGVTQYMTGSMKFSGTLRTM